MSFAAIFDMDGVLVDTVNIHWRVYNEVLARDFGVRVPDTELPSLIGMSLPEQIPILNDTFSIQVDTKKFIEETDQKIAEKLREVQPEDGAVQLVRSLKSNSVPIAVGTSSPLWSAKLKLQAIDLIDCFSVIIAEEHVKQHKPDPEVYLLAAKKLNVEPSKCIVLEDAPNGITAAQRAGMKSIAITTPYTAEEQLANASLVVHSLVEVDVETIKALSQT